MATSGTGDGRDAAPAKGIPRTLLGKKFPGTKQGTKTVPPKPPPSKTLPSKTLPAKTLPSKTLPLKATKTLPSKILPLKATKALTAS
mmetsp:Transcript_17323/g.34485  ORF Transcript_17323/g.34485 Transcript_17323/m.34485 type:complete len:87 (+) Transcript_17323:53-313(+)